MTHILELDGTPQTGTWWCTRCHKPLEYAADARWPCTRVWEWDARRVEAFRAAARKPQ